MGVPPLKQSSLNYFFTQQAWHLFAAQQQLIFAVEHAAIAVETGAAAATPPTIIIAARTRCDLDIAILKNLSSQYSANELAPLPRIITRLHV